MPTSLVCYILSFTGVHTLHSHVKHGSLYGLVVTPIVSLVQPRVSSAKTKRQMQQYYSPMPLYLQKKFFTSNFTYKIFFFLTTINSVNNLICGIFFLICLNLYRTW